MNAWRSLLFVPLCLLGLLSCTKQAEPVPSRLIILGFDGMDPALVRQWMAEGHLPHFKRLAESGEFKPLKTSNPPQSPVAWSSFATGTPPGKHGIYDFLRRKPRTYTPAFSISETLPPDNVLSLFGLKLPLDSAELVNRRVGEPFWTTIEDQGGRSTVLRVPVTFPPDPVHRMMSGMGVPDLLGTQGTYTLFTTRPAITSATSSARSMRLRPNRRGHIETRLEGPPHPLRPEAPPLSTPMALDPAGDEGVRIKLGDSDVTLGPGEWSDWITVEFAYLGPLAVSGTVRLYLISSYPTVQLYVSPIQIDPREPVVPLSSPPDYATDLVDRFGLYHTIGMPEETWSLNEGHLSDEAFLEMVRTTLAEREFMFFDALDRVDSDVVVGVFVQTDRVAHMFYRGIDPAHPLHAQSGPQARQAIRWIYGEADRILGKTLERMQPADRLIVLSDHGFAPFRRAVNLNRWLVQEGLMALQHDESVSGIGYASVDWQRTQAYAVGLNSVFVNRAAREGQGVVDEQNAAAVKRRIISRLPALTDPQNGSRVVKQVYDGAEIYPGNANGDAPDLVVGYYPGYRASWQTTLGAVPATLIEDNRKKWSGDHCVAPDTVPGVLFTSFEPDVPLNSLADVAKYAKRHWNTRP